MSPRPAATALEAAIQALARRDLSAAELDARLERAGVSAEERAVTLARLVDAGYLDDARVTGERVRVLAVRGWGDAAIRHDLARRGVAGGLVQGALEAVGDEADRARELVGRLGRGPKVARALARKGFSSETIERVLGPIVAEPP